MSDIKQDDSGNRNKKLQLFSKLSPEIQANARRAGANMRNKATETTPPTDPTPQRMTFTIWVNDVMVKKTLPELIKMLADGVIRPHSTEIIYNNTPMILSTIPEYTAIEKSVQEYSSNQGRP